MSLLGKLTDLVRGTKAKDDDEDIGYNLGRGASVLCIDKTDPAYVTYDGSTHINIDLRAKTSLGRMLHQSWNGRFHHPKYGPFDSMDGFWAYVKTNFKEDRFRYMDAQTARKTLKTYTGEQPSIPDFIAVIMEANYIKCVSNEQLRNSIKLTVEPFDMYYIQTDPNRPNDPGCLVRPQLAYWFITGMEYIRDCIQHDTPWNTEHFNKLVAEVEAQKL